MAITVLSQPQELQAGYNPVKFYLDSTNKNERGFRYVVEVYEGVTKLFEQRYPPRPVDGYADVDISRLVADYLSATIPFDNTTFLRADGHFLKYDIKFGEEYIVEWEFDDYGLNGTFQGGNTGLFQSPTVTPHPFVVGDQVRVKTNATYTDNRASLNGLFTVVGIEDAYDFVISLNDVGSFPATPGTVVFADGRKTIFRDLESIEDLVVFNGTLDLKSFIDWNSDLYKLNAITDARWLTNAPQGFRIKPDSDVWLSFWRNGETGVRYIVRNSNGDIFRCVISGGSNNIIDLYYLLSTDLIALSGSLPVIKDDTQWVTMKIELTSGEDSESFKFNIDRRCTIEDYDIVFMDWLGSFLPFSFSLRSEDMMSIERKQYNKKFGDYADGDFVVNTYDSGHTPFYHDATETKLLRTNYLTDAESVYFKELMTSGWTYIKINGDYYRCTVEVNSHNTIRQKNKNLIRYDVTVKYSMQTPINL